MAIKAINAGITVWPRYPARVDFLRRTLCAFDSRVRADAVDAYPLYERFAVVEVDKSPADLLQAATRLLRRHGWTVLHHAAPANLGGAYNQLLAACAADFVFFLQDDMRPTSFFDISTDAAFLDAADGDAVRHRWDRLDSIPADASTPSGIDGRVAYRKIIDGRLYSDQAFLARRALFTRMPPYALDDFEACVISEQEMDAAWRRGGARVWGRGDGENINQYIEHLGDACSSMTEKWAIFAARGSRCR